VLKLQEAAGQSTEVRLDPTTKASLAMGFVMGRWLRFAKSGFKAKPSDQATEILAGLF